MRRGRSGDPHRGRARPLRGHARRTGSGSAGCRGGGRAPRPGRRGAFRLHGNHLGKRGRLCDAHPVRVDHRGAGRGGSPGHVLRGALRRYQRRGPRSADFVHALGRRAKLADPALDTPVGRFGQPHLRRPRVVEELPARRRRFSGYRAVRALLRAQRAPRCGRFRDRLRHNAKGVDCIPDGNSCHLGRRGLHRLQRGRPHDHVPSGRRRLHHRAALARPRYRGAERAMRRVAAFIANRRFRLAFATTLLMLAVLFLPAAPAYASIADDVNAWLAGLLRDACNWMFTNQVAVLSSIGYDGIIGADFSQMLTTAGDVSMYDIAHGVWDVAVLPIGCGVLSLVFTVKLIQISQRMDGNASFPGVKEVVFLLVFFAVFLFLIQNSFELMEAVYSVVGLAIDRTMALFGSGGAMDLTAVNVVTEDDDVPALIALLLVSVISWVVVLGAYIVALVVCWARAIQLYIMAAFSPIPLSLMALDDTRQIGIGYLKNFTAVCLAGLIILILLIAFPLILGGLTGASTSTGTPIDGIATGLTYALQYLAMCVLLILSLVKSGAWARDIVSGI